MNLRNFPKRLDSKTSCLRIAVPENLDLALEGLIRKVLREQPKTDDIYAFAAEYFETLLKIRDKTGAKFTATQLCPFHNDEDAHEMIKLAGTFNRATPAKFSNEPKTKKPVKRKEGEGKTQIKKETKRQKSKERLKEKRPAEHKQATPDLIKKLPKVAEPERRKKGEEAEKPEVEENEEEFLKSDPIKELVEKELEATANKNKTEGREKTEAGVENAQKGNVTTEDVKTEEDRSETGKTEEIQRSHNEMETLKTEENERIPTGANKTNEEETKPEQSQETTDNLKAEGKTDEGNEEKVEHTTKIDEKTVEEAREADKGDTKAVEKVQKMAELVEITPEKLKDLAKTEEQPQDKREEGSPTQMEANETIETVKKVSEDLLTAKPSEDFPEKERLVQDEAADKNDKADVPPSSVEQEKLQHEVNNTSLTEKQSTETDIKDSQRPTEQETEAKTTEREIKVGQQPQEQEEANATETLTESSPTETKSEEKQPTDSKTKPENQKTDSAQETSTTMSGIKPEEFPSVENDKAHTEKQKTEEEKAVTETATAEDAPTDVGNPEGEQEELHNSPKGNSTHSEVSKTTEECKPEHRMTENEEKAFGEIVTNSEDQTTNEVKTNQAANSDNETAKQEAATAEENFIPEVNSAEGTPENIKPADDIPAAEKEAEELAQEISNLGSSLAEHTGRKPTEEKTEAEDAEVVGKSEKRETALTETLQASEDAENHSKKEPTADTENINREETGEELCSVVDIEHIPKETNSNAEKGKKEEEEKAESAEPKEVEILQAEDAAEELCTVVDIEHIPKEEKRDDKSGEDGRITKYEKTEPEEVCTVVDTEPSAKEDEATKPEVENSQAAKSKEEEINTSGEMQQPSEDSAKDTETPKTEAENAGTVENKQEEPETLEVSQGLSAEDITNTELTKPEAESEKTENKTEESRQLSVEGTANADSTKTEENTQATENRKEMHQLLVEDKTGSEIPEKTENGTEEVSVEGKAGTENQKSEEENKQTAEAKKEESQQLSVEDKAGSKTPKPDVENSRTAEDKTEEAIKSEALQQTLEESTSGKPEVENTAEGIDVSGELQQTLTDSTTDTERRKREAQGEENGETIEIMDSQHIIKVEEVESTTKPEDEPTGEIQIKTIQTHYYDTLQVPETITKEYRVHNIAIPTAAGLLGAATMLQRNHQPDLQQTVDENMNSLTELPEGVTISPPAEETTAELPPTETDKKTDSLSPPPPPPSLPIETGNFDSDDLLDLMTPTSGYSLNLSDISLATVSEFFLDSEKRYSSREKEEIRYVTPRGEESAAIKNPPEVEEVIEKTTLPRQSAVPVPPREEEEINEGTNATENPKGEEKKEEGDEEKPESDTPEDSSNGKSDDSDIPFISVEVKTVIETQLLDDEDEDKDGAEGERPEVGVKIQATIDFQDRLQASEPKPETVEAERQMSDAKSNKRTEEFQKRSQDEGRKESCSTDQTTGMEGSSADSDLTTSSAATEIKRTDSSNRNSTSIRSLVSTQSLDLGKRNPLVKTRSLSTFRHGVTDFEVWNKIEKELEDAAIKIQSKFRGYKTRKKLRRENAVQITTEESSLSTTPVEAEGQQSTGEFHDSVILSEHPR